MSERSPRAPDGDGEAAGPRLAIILQETQDGSVLLAHVSVRCISGAHDEWIQTFLTWSTFAKFFGGWVHPNTAGRRSSP